MSPAIALAITSPSLRLLIAQLTQTLPGPPPEVRHERLTMARHLIVNMCVERERALADRTPVRQPTWNALATTLTDAIAGLWQAPVTG
ncbi:hypothetical protein [Microtetraspora glauca]|uniref:MftR C-terminal domain-containing protein n=1 Tax=Microtetraspora glauca TaxID=1996 RepID=A0ABV3GKK8_MICGL